AIVGGVNLMLDPELSTRTLGYPLGFSRHYEFLWCYPVLALAAASLVSPSNPVRRCVERASFPTAVNAIVSFLASLNYGVYFFHGAWILFALHGLGWGHGRRMFVFATCASVLSAWLIKVVRLRIGGIYEMS